MNDAATMRLRNSRASLKDIFDGVADWEWCSAHADEGEVAPVEVLHDEERSAVVHAIDVEYPRYVLTLNLRGSSALAKESLDEPGVSPKMRMEDFDCNAPIEILMVSFEDEAHPALAD